MLRVVPGQQVLDLGCGTGSVTEYIAGRTGASMLGIDFAPSVIAFAQERTKDKRDRLSFQVMDMDELTLPPQRFDRVLSIDTLYFVSDLPKTIAALIASMKPDGELGILYSSQVFAGQSTELLMPTTTKLAKALTECGLTFETWDFTADERDLWERSLQVANDLKRDFEAEGSLPLYEGRIGEASRILGQYNAGRARRYLYHVRCRAA